MISPLAFPIAFFLFFFFSRRRFPLLCGERAGPLAVRISEHPHAYSPFLSEMLYGLFPPSPESRRIPPPSFESAGANPFSSPALQARGLSFFFPLSRLYNRGPGLLFFSFFLPASEEVVPFPPEDQNPADSLRADAVFLLLSPTRHLFHPDQFPSHTTPSFSPRAFMDLPPGPGCRAHPFRHLIRHSFLICAIKEAPLRDSRWVSEPLSPSPPWRAMRSASPSCRDSRRDLPPSTGDPFSLTTLRHASNQCFFFPLLQGTRRTFPPRENGPLFPRGYAELLAVSRIISSPPGPLLKRSLRERIR